MAAMTRLVHMVCGVFFAAAISPSSVSAQVAGPAQGRPASSVASQAQDQADPLSLASRQLWQKASAECRPPPGGKLQVVVIGFMPNDESMAADQKQFLGRLLDVAVDKAIRDAGSNAVLVNQKGIVDLVAIMGAGRSREEVTHMIRESREGWNVGIFASASRVGADYSIQLRAESWKERGVECFVPTDPVILPSHMVPEPVYPQDILLERAARSIMDAGIRVDQMVAVRARMAGQQYSPPQLNEHFSRVLNRGIQSTTDKGTQEIGTKPVRIDAQPYDQVKAGQKQWDMDVVVREGARNSVRLEIEMRPPTEASARGLNYQGLIPPDDLPPLPAIAYAGRLIGGKAGVFEQVAPANAVPQLPLSSQPSRVALQLNARQPRAAYGFSLKSEAVIEMDITEIQGPEPPRLNLFSADGREVVGEAPSTTKPNLRRYRLAGGSYLVQLAASPSAAADFTLRTRGSADVLTPEAAGRVTREVGDWVVGVVERPGAERVCYAFTPAMAVSPIHWRTQAPTLLFQMNGSDDNVSQRFDIATNYSLQTPIIGTVQLPGNQTLSMQLAATEGGPVQAVGQCSDGTERCMRNDMIQSLTRGSRITVSGRPRPAAPGARPLPDKGSVQYSLNGYQAAMYAMAFECGRKDFADNLVQREPNRPPRRTDKR
jgi:hypothetical protein